MFETKNPGRLACDPLYSNLEIRKLSCAPFNRGFRELVTASNSDAVTRRSQPALVPRVSCTWAKLTIGTSSIP